MSTSIFPQLNIICRGDFIFAFFYDAHIYFIYSHEGAIRGDMINQSLTLNVKYFMYNGVSANLQFIDDVLSIAPSDRKLIKLKIYIGIYVL